MDAYAKKKGKDFAAVGAKGEEERKRKKAERKMKKKALRGVKLVSQREWDDQKAKEEENHERNVARHMLPKSFPVPEDVKVDAIEERDPALWQQLMEGRRVRASQDDDEYRTRAIWLNEIDKERTFNRKFEQCRMIYTLLCYRINQGEEPSFIETEYLHAVEEYRVHQEPDYAPFLEQGDAFENREAFIKVWREGDKDLFVFPKHEVKRFKELVGSLSEFNQHTVPPPPSFEDTDEEFNAFVAQDYETSGHAPTAVTPLAGPEAAGFRAVATDEVRLGDLPKEYKPAQPVSLTKPSTKGIFKMRAEHQVDEEDSDDDGDEGEGDELMRSSDMPEIARTWLDILDEYNDLVEHGGLSDDANRARATKLQEELARAMSANQSEKQILAKLEDTRL